MAVLLKGIESIVWDPDDIEGAFRFCRDLARRHYENFPVASLLLPRYTRRHVGMLYAFSRIADDFSDEPAYEGVRLDRLNSWRDQLWAGTRNSATGAPGAGASGSGTTHPVFLALRHSLSELNLPIELFDDLLSAFIQDATKSRYSTFGEVLDYCRRSANPVGRLVLLIHGLRDERLFSYSDKICTGLQLANFWQDLGVDLKKGRLYVPEEDLRKFGVGESDLMCLHESKKPALRELMRFEVARARDILKEGKPLISRLHWPLSFEIRLTLGGGLRILDKIEKDGFNTLHRRPALGKLDWLKIGGTLLSK